MVLTVPALRWSLLCAVVRRDVHGRGVSSYLPRAVPVMQDLVAALEEDGQRLATLHAFLVSFDSHKGW